MSDSGLGELWVECDILGANAAQNVMGGQRLCTCHQDTQTNSASSLAIATPTTPCIPGRY